MSTLPARSDAEFRKAINDAIGRRHQANHPLIDKFARGEVKRETVAGTITEIWYWISKLIPEALLLIAANVDREVRRRRSHDSRLTFSRSTAGAPSAPRRNSCAQPVRSLVGGLPIMAQPLAKA